MNMGLRLSIIITTVLLSTGCGVLPEEDKKEKNKKSEPNSATQTENLVQAQSDCATPQVQTEKKDSDLFGGILGQILKNPDLLNDFMTIFSSLFGGNNQEGPLAELFAAMQGGNADQITDLLKGNADLIAQIETILAGLNSTSLALDTPSCYGGSEIP